MSGKHSPRSNDEWMALITQCRKSGLSDRAWCDQNGIPSSSFYNAVTRLRKQACEIPETVHAVPIMDLRARQDVVRINIVQDELPDVPEVTELSAPQILPTEHLEKSHMIEINLNDFNIRVCNGADPALLKVVLNSLRSLSC